MLFKIKRAAFPIRDQDDLDGCAELARVGTTNVEQARDCLERLLSKSAGKSAGRSHDARRNVRSVVRRSIR